jgi:hypothetical protein
VVRFRSAAIAVIGIDIGKNSSTSLASMIGAQSVAAEVVTWAVANATYQCAALSDRDGSLRRCASSQAQAGGHMPG